MNTFSLPATSWEDLKTIIVSYANQKNQTSNDDIAKLAGLSTDKVSRNNKFLTDFGLIEGGNKKQSTALCNKLGRAILHDMPTDVRNCLVELVEQNEPLSELITYLRIKKEVSCKDYVAHILYVSGQTKTQYSKAGSSCILDILLLSEYITESDGTLRVNTDLQKNDNSVEIEDSSTDKQELEDGEELSDVVNNKQSMKVDPKPQIAINIQLQLPESDNPEVYENLFKSLRKNLIDG